MAKQKAGLVIGGLIVAVVAGIAISQNAKAKPSQLYYGDVNGDGLFTDADWQNVERMELGLTTALDGHLFTADEVSRADANHNGVVDQD
jgi:hypothetical protein